MIYFKEANLDDVVKEFEAIMSIPSEENGYKNAGHILPEKMAECI